MFRFLTFLILILLIQRWLKSLQEQQEQQKEQKEPTEKEAKDYFQILGFPPAEELPPKPKLEKPKEPVVTVKKEVEKTELKIAELKPVKIEPSPQQIEEIEEQLPDFSSDKLEQGIILSEILGPPKAYQTRRGGGIG
jgi:hypothetical protein